MLFGYKESAFQVFKIAFRGHNAISIEEMTQLHRECIFEILFLRLTPTWVVFVVYFVFKHCQGLSELIFVRFGINNHQ